MKHQSIMTDKSDWPEMADEIARKGLEELQRWMERQQAGKATKRDLFVATEVLYAVMSGLAPWSATDLVTKVNLDIRNGSKILKR